MQAVTSRMRTEKLKPINSNSFHEAVSVETTNTKKLPLIMYVFFFSMTIEHDVVSLYRDDTRICTLLNYLFVNIKKAYTK